MALVPLNDGFKIIENSTLHVSFFIILNNHLIGLVAMVYLVIVPYGVQKSYRIDVFPDTYYDILASPPAQFNN